MNHTNTMKQPMCLGERDWEPYKDEDGRQFQVVDGARVIATGIETSSEAVMMAASKKMAEALHEILGASHERTYFLAKRALIEAGYTDE